MKIPITTSRVFSTLGPAMLLIALSQGGFGAGRRNAVPGRPVAVPAG